MQPLTLTLGQRCDAAAMAASTREAYAEGRTVYWLATRRNRREFARVAGALGDWRAAYGLVTRLGGEGRYLAVFCHDAATAQALTYWPRRKAAA